MYLHTLMHQRWLNSIYLLIDILPKCFIKEKLYALFLGRNPSAHITDNALGVKRCLFFFFVISEQVF